MRFEPGGDHLLGFEAVGEVGRDRFTGQDRIDEEAGSYRIAGKRRKDLARVQVLLDVLGYRQELEPGLVVADAADFGPGSGSGENKIRFQRTALSVQPAVLLGPPVADMRYQAGVDGAVHAVGELDQQQGRVVGRVEGFSVGARSFDVMGQVGADADDFTAVPPRHVDHV